MKRYSEIVNEWKQKEIKNENDLDLVLDNYKILFAYNSNVIENENTTYHDTREVFENGRIINYTGDLRTLYEINNQKFCYEYLKPLIVKKEPLSVDLVKKVHKILMKGCYDERRYARGERAGKFKVHDYIVGDDVGVEAKDVEQYVAMLCEEVNLYQGENPVTTSAYFHLNFESIHPFADGNGRVGRTLMNYNLMINDHPPIIIYNEDKVAYYMALAIFDKTGKIDGFEQFIKEECEKTWNVKQLEMKPLKESLKFNKENINFVDKVEENTSIINIPNGVVVDGKNLSGGWFFHKNKDIKKTDNQIELTFEVENPIIVRFDDCRTEKVSAEKLKAAFNEAHASEKQEDLGKDNNLDEEL